MRLLSQMNNGQACCLSAPPPPVGHALSRSRSGTCRVESVLLDQQPSLLTLRRRAFRLCSNDSSVLCRCPTPRRRTCGPCGLSLLPPSCDSLWRRRLRGLPVLVHEVSRRVWGLRLRRTEPKLALTFRFMLPSAHYKDVGVRVASFRSSIAHPAYSPVYASPCTSRYPTQNSGPSGSLLLTRKNFAFSASCRFIPAHCNRDFSPTDKRNEQVGYARQEKRPNSEIESSRSLNRP